ncbi:sugar ABC transporter ATP-binding protein, partial [Bacillus pseudomycoides]
PKEVYETPENIFVGGFIGSPAMNFFRGKLTEQDFVIDDKVKIKVSEGKMKLLREQGYVNQEVVLGIRPEDIHDELL